MRCPSCNHGNRAERRFCAECGAALATACLSCGASNEPGEKFCGGCGARLGAPSAAPEVPTRFAAPETTVPTGERRQLTVLFCDLVGSTPLSQELDPEEWRYVVEQYQKAASAAVAPWGGHVAKEMGDGLLVYFGWPAARENDPERAVRAGLAILDAMVGVNEQLAAEDGPRLAVRIGMHTGPVVIADGGEIFGETANIAARLPSAAEPDTVVITDATQRLVAGMFVIEERGPQVLKGVREPLALYRVVRPSGVRSRLDLAAGRLTRFVGRDMEIGTLLDRWERATDGHGQNVLLLGEAGVGKSRLAWELRARMAAERHTWLECRATPYTQGTPFFPVIELLARGMAFPPDDSVADKIAKLERGLECSASRSWKRSPSWRRCSGCRHPTGIRTRTWRRTWRGSGRSRSSRPGTWRSARRSRSCCWSKTSTGAIPRRSSSSAASSSRAPRCGCCFSARLVASSCRRGRRDPTPRRLSRRASPDARRARW